MTDRRGQQRQDQQRDKGAGRESPRRIDVDVGEAFDMQPQHEQQQHRLAQQMQKFDENEKAVGHSAGDEITRHRTGEDRQRVHQLRRANRDILRHFIPHQPVTGDAQRYDHPQIGNAGHP